MNCHYLYRSHGFTPLLVWAFCIEVLFAYHHKRTTRPGVGLFLRQPGRGPSPGLTWCGCLSLCPKDPSNVAEENHDHELQELTTVQRHPVQEQPPTVPCHSDGCICNSQCSDWHADDLPKYCGSGGHQGQQIHRPIETPSRIGNSSPQRTRWDFPTFGLL